MGKPRRYLWLVLLGAIILSGCDKKQSLYHVADTPWPESFGNHRAVLKINTAGDATQINIPWRRHDRDPEKRSLLLISAETGDTVANIHRLHVDGERCELVAGPVKPGIHYLYYLPFEVQEGYGFYNRDYLPRETPANEDWLAGIAPEAASVAVLDGFESRTALDNFYPMEVVPLEAEKTAFLKNYPDTFLLFTEDRKNPIRMWDELPLKWIEDPVLNYFEGTARPGEYYTFQVGLYASKADVDQIRVSFSDLRGSRGSSLDKTRLTCFNVEGIDTYGKPFEKEVNVRRDRVQAFWLGVDIPDDLSQGTYTGSIRIGPEEGSKKEVKIKLKIRGRVLADRGDSEAWRHSRLRWLNSTAGQSKDPVAPYPPIRQLGDSTFKLGGKQLSAGAKGLPASIRVNDAEILKRPITFSIKGAKGNELFAEPLVESVINYGGVLEGTWTDSSAQLEYAGEGILEADAYLRYRFSLKALADIRLEDVNLEIPFQKEVAEYMMGMGLPGTAMPGTHQSDWDGPEDSFWIGNTRGGLWVELRGSSYHGPLLNLYHPAPPGSWDNHGRGGFRIESGDAEVVATVFSGEHKLEKGEELSFEFAFLITPVKAVDQASQFLNRYYHNAGQPDPEPEDLQAGVRIVNLHHANPFNPFINYPFIEVDKMKTFVERNQAKGLKVKIYYTIRELSNHLPEIWALRSLQGEIFDYGPGGGYPWLREHLVSGYRHQWYDHSDDTRVDASLLTSPGDSRWINYYIEGLGWLVRNVGIDGLYMDDVSFDRHIMKRIRRVMDQEKTGCIIDLHSNTGFSKGPAIQYTEFFPYVDKLWFGESFMYNEMSFENWLVEVSGLPFGHMGDMLHGGGNPWLGMVFGMTSRLPWSTEGVLCNPIAIWKIWDEFNIDQSRMSGFWDINPVAETSHPQVKATAYIHNDQALLSIGNFTDETQEVTLRIDWDQLGFGPENYRLLAPEIESFQDAITVESGAKIRVEARKGCLFYLESTVQ